MRPLHLGLLKPDVGVAGGFERVVDRVEAALRTDGHRLTRVTVDLKELPHRPFGREVADEVWQAAPEYFRYAAGLEAFDRADLTDFDAVISTQPPSFAAPHPHHLSLFFHHHRVYYDLEAPFIEAGFVADPALHRRAGAQVRALDAPRLDAVGWFAAGSETVRRRLGRFNGIDRVSLFHAGRAVEADAPVPPATADPRTGPVLCVGRLEFPKRTELFVSAMRRLPQVPATIVGSGGRRAWVRAVDHRLSRPGTDLDSIDDRALWCSRGEGGEPAPEGWESNIALAGGVDDATLVDLYSRAPCVVAPALDEDYGLTAIEAMAHGTPVVVCDDGGGLADLVDHEVDGLVVEPTGEALAAAVERILTDADLAAGLAEGARAHATQVTWERAHQEIRLALAITMDEAESSDPPA